MSADKTLHDQLRTWAAAVAGDQVLRATPTGTERIEPLEMALLAVDAMRVESIVQCMERTGRWKEARVLRTEYCLAGMSEGDRLARMARLGLRISRASYYAYLASAHAFVAGALSFSLGSEVA
ncbi:hypothetical protein [Xanthomonas phaseoli]|uniref:hypothetical protein n=1 Tax=Xanthomonas phaseoli TaxID=1985254 RepID=UPI00031D6B44|nr:hypothetical protein [Xanthomonas phaseoli]RWU12449.1 hypothetical protein XANMN_23300 [Xanthomonas phaseoli pv. manihotis str. CIO151]UEQ13650.1 hypothetical protein K9838_13020 [Xanthomonas phaseoli pv. manihotis]